ncbi:MAG: type I restriction endonuclease, partial [bacterium]|nr:type I restriction endonuclease [bacterium]
MSTTRKFTEAQLEDAIIRLLGDQGYPHVCGTELVRDPGDVLIRSDLRAFLAQRYASDNITAGEIDSILRQLDALNSLDLYDSNKTICKWVADGFLLKREDRNEKDLYIQLIDYAGLPCGRVGRSGDPEERSHFRADRLFGDGNIYKIVNQLEIEGSEKRIPDAILYVNGLPLVVFEFKSAIRENATLHDGYVQLTTRYVRDIPELMKY